eukprot:CAMPEP_0170498244 /NCGR_PEP_ID=MMETSP0208-20121228/27253_1 /TAXON_ID=197538 /ORGANISM="Strombidium inclinatum, Strain S3" /LENGTH=117 /DNA_ID=CAMNT_0010775367 /DNA_START=964 /DNA_END=1317 /DNA_ORIENTATION=+
MLIIEYERKEEDGLLDHDGVDHRLLEFLWSAFDQVVQADHTLPWEGEPDDAEAEVHHSDIIGEVDENLGQNLHGEGHEDYRNSAPGVCEGRHPGYTQDYPNEEAGAQEPDFVLRSAQ